MEYRDDMDTLDRIKWYESQGIPVGSRVCSPIKDLSKFDSCGDKIFIPQKETRHWVRYVTEEEMRELNERAKRQVPLSLTPYRTLLHEIKRKGI